MNIRHFAVVASLLTLVVAAACGPTDIGSSRLKSIKDGANREAVLSALGTGPLNAVGSDSVRVVNGFRREMFESGGKTYEVLYYREAPGDVSEALTRNLETPIVLEDGIVVGHGWKYYDKLGKAVGLPVAPETRN